MTHRIERDEETLYSCEVCGFIYKEKLWAEKCQNYCAEYRACSLEITSHAVEVTN